ncbi:MAG: flagellar basal body rod protein FlgC [Terracidiphilus sp.]|jgi:flagellar basal-body rod protein FlgC
MNLFAMMETSGGAMSAERMRAEVVAANMANAETTRTASGGPYHRQHVVFAANTGDAEFASTFNSAAGVMGTASAALESHATAALPPLPSPVPLLHPVDGLNRLASGSGSAPGVGIAAVVEDTAPPLKRYDPGHPDAGPDGYVSYPDINPLTEMVDLMGATRAYGLNSSAVQAEKGMISAALEIAKS